MSRKVAVVGCSVVVSVAEEDLRMEQPASASVNAVDRNGVRVWTRGEPWPEPGPEIAVGDTLAITVDGNTGDTTVSARLVGVDAEPEQQPEPASEQRYTHPRSLNWMAFGLCPECGYAAEEHSTDARFWIPRGCSLREDGVRNRLAQFKRDVGVDAPAQGGTMPGVSCPVCHAAAGQPCEKRDDIDRVPHLARLQKTLQKGEAMPTRAQLAAAALREKRGLPPRSPEPQHIIEDRTIAAVMEALSEKGLLALGAPWPDAVVYAAGTVLGIPSREVIRAIHEKLGRP